MPSAIRRFGFAITLLATGCVSSGAKQQEDLLSKPVAESYSALINVPFVPQAADACGPATLAMAIAWTNTLAKDPAAVARDLEAEILTPEKGGTLQVDMIGAARRRGLLAVEVSQMADLLTELRAGHPVIVFENLRTDWWPQWHYALVIGFNAAEQRLVLHSGTSRQIETDLATFERDWAKGGKWALVVLPPGELAMSKGELAHVHAAAALERLNLHSAAQKAYESILRLWPESLGGLVGLANIKYTDGDFAGAAFVLQKASVAHPEVAGVWNNLAFAYLGMMQLSEAKKAAHQALTLARGEEQVDLAKSLKPVLSASSQ